MRNDDANAPVCQTIEEEARRSSMMFAIVSLLLATMSAVLLSRIDGASIWQSLQLALVCVVAIVALAFSKKARTVPNVASASIIISILVLIAFSARSLVAR